MPHAQQPTSRALDEARLRFIVGARTTFGPQIWRSITGTGRSSTGRSSTPHITLVRPAERAGRQQASSPFGTRSSIRGRGGRWAYSKKRAARDNQTLTAQTTRARAVIAGEYVPSGQFRFVTTHAGDAT